MGLAALALVLMGLAVLVGGVDSATPWGALVVPIGLAGLGLGLAVVRPPCGVLRRILVALGALVILVVAGGAITIFVWLYYFSYWG